MRVDDDRKERQSYLFVNTVRFWSMFAVITVHCLNMGGLLVSPPPPVWMLLSVPLKFGTIGFFLISGFLLGDRLQTSHPGAYFFRRLRRVFLPWLFWYGMIVGYYVAQALRETHTSRHLDAAGMRCLGQALLKGLFGSPLWFVPNLLLGMGILLLFRRYLHRLALGYALLVPTLFYAVNIYFKWVPSEHPQALLGFVFYLWLGSYVSYRRERFLAWLEGVPMGLLAGLALAAGAAAWMEFRLLAGMHSIDPLNTLRLSNQVYSVLVMLMLLKLRRQSWPSFVHVRQQIFGVYLSHTIVLMLLLRSARYSLRGHEGSRMLHSAWGVGSLMGMTELVAWCICLGLTRLLAASSTTRWMVGAFQEHTSRLETRQPTMALTAAQEMQGQG